MNGPPKGARGGTNAQTFSAKLSKVYELVDDLKKDHNGVQDFERMTQELKLKTEETAKKTREVDELRKQAQEKVAQLLTQLQQKDAQHQQEILRLEAEVRAADKMIDSFENRCKRFGEESVRLVADSSRVQQLSKEVEQERERLMDAERENRVLLDKIGKLEARIADNTSKISSLNIECRVNAAQAEKADNSLLACVQTLEQLKEDIGMLPAIDPDKK